MRVRLVGTTPRVTGCRGPVVSDKLEFDKLRSGMPRVGVRREFRTDLCAKGITDVVKMAAAFREEWGYPWLRSFRVACGLTAAETAYQFNAFFSLAKGDRGYYHVSVIGKNETWPYSPTSRRASVSTLTGLAIVYGTHPRFLLDPTLREGYHPADLFLLETYRPPLVPTR